MTKLVGMLYRDVNIALANELAAFCEVVGVDFTRVRAAANSDGEASVLLAGIGVGGHCTPVYPYFLTTLEQRKRVRMHRAACRQVQLHDVVDPTPIVRSSATTTARGAKPADIPPPAP